MSEQAKPTPGPWHVYGRTNGLQIAVVGPSNSREESITYVWGQNGEAEANARLIAAAPELLEALEDIDFAVGNGCSEERWAKIMGHARAAIAKARGGSDA